MYGSETGPMKVEHHFTCVAYCYTYVNMSQIFYVGMEIKFVNLSGHVKRVCVYER